MLPRLRLLQPTTIAEASGALRDLDERGRIYAGGAELLLLMRQRLLETEVLIDIKKIERMNSLRFDESGIRVGACVTHAELEKSSVVQQHAPSFAYAESQVANVRVRSQGTVGGNLCFNDPHSDPATVLLVHEAFVTLGSQERERSVALGEFLLGAYTTALQPDELLVEVNIPPLPQGMRSAYLRVHRYQRPTLGVAVAVKTHSRSICDSKLAVGCVGPKAQRLPEIESKINGAELKDIKKVIADQKSYLRKVLHPVDDMLGSIEYKVYMTCRLLSAALEQAAEGNGVTAPLTLPG